jgi:hypothetical protein
MNTSTKNNTNALKLVFGVIIFAFSLAFAYFLASFTDKHAILDYWGTVMILAGLYIVVGVMVANIFPVSLGFLFSADILVLHALMTNFGDLYDVIKALFVGLILAVLYLVAWMWFPDLEYKVEEQNLSAPPTDEAKPIMEAPVFKTESDQPVVDLDLNDHLRKIDIGGAQKVIFSPNGMSAFSTSEPSIIRIALYTKQLYGKNQFQPGELKDLFVKFINSYTPTLSEEKVQIVADKMKNFVTVGGKFEVM